MLLRSNFHVHFAELFLLCSRQNESFGFSTYMVRFIILPDIASRAKLHFASAGRAYKTSAISVLAEVVIALARAFTLFKPVQRFLTTAHTLTEFLPARSIRPC